MPAQQYQWIRPAAARSKDSFYELYQLLSDIIGHVFNSPSDCVIGQWYCTEFGCCTIAYHYSAHVLRCRQNESLGDCMRFTQFTDSLATTYDASKHCLDTVLCTEMVACCWWRPSSFLLKYSAGLFLMPACFVSRCLFNLQGFILSFASTSAHTTHWGLRSAVTVNPNCRYASSYLRSFFAAGGASVGLLVLTRNFSIFVMCFQ